MGPGLPGEVQGDDRTTASTCSGWTGDYNDADNFLGVFFGAEVQRVGLRQRGDLRRVDGGRAHPDAGGAEPLYQEINRQIMDFLPGVPLRTRSRRWGSRRDVEGFQQSPVQDEVWNVSHG